jgi:hypothetical protein
MWQLLEPVHAVVYFAPDARARFDAIGLRGFWMGYFASRSAALGAAPAEVVTAAFYVFHPGAVGRALPDAWGRAGPDDVLAARRALAHDTLVAAVGGDADGVGDGVVDAAEVVVDLARQAPAGGRVLGAAHAALSVPDEPLLRLWWAATALRELRGDGHVAALLAAGVDPCEALVLAAAGGAVGPDGAAVLQGTRKWPDGDWSAATDRLVNRGWLAPADAGPVLTQAGRGARRDIERRTDELAATAYAPLDDGELAALDAALAPIARAIVAAGAVPRVNPIGLAPD